MSQLPIADQPLVAGFKVRITKIESIPVHIPFRVPLQIASGGPRPVTEAVIVRIKTDQGVEGIGETQAWRRQGSAETLASLKYAIDEYLTPEIIGKSPFDLPAITRLLDEALYSSLYAKAAILDAFYDLQGKLLGVPTYALLGGKARDRIRACAVLPIKDDFGATLENASELQAAGYDTFIIKVGLNAVGDLSNISAIRKKLPKAALRVDANGCMGFSEALSLLKKVEIFDIAGAEQMVPSWDTEGMAELGRRVTIPMIADECLSSDRDLLKLVKARAVSAIQTKAAKNGGIWNTRNLWAIAHSAGIGICPGNHPCASIATASVVQLAAAWPGPLLAGPFAVGVSGFLSADLVTEPLRIENGYVLVPEAPGLGVTIDEKALRALRVDL
jgi:L-alanine-DL-glutamate epimerase-like enolase superfamily enzyme